MIIALCSGVGFQTSITALQISAAKSISVPVKLSGEYSNVKFVSVYCEAMSFIIFAPNTAKSIVSCLEFPKTTSLCNVEVELYKCTIAFLAPVKAENVFSIIFALDCVKTCIVTSSGIKFWSISALVNSYSVSEAAGKPISMVLNPISTRN